MKRPLRASRTVERYFVRAVDCDRAISDFGEAKKGVWLRVPQRIYRDIKHDAEVTRSGSWEVKIENVVLEDTA